MIGVAAAFGTVDDAGRRELIGLAATAHLAIYPMWFGLKAVYGFDPADKPLEFLLVFFMDTFTISIAALLTYRIIRLKGHGIRRFVEKTRKKKD